MFNQASHDFTHPAQTVFDALRTMPPDWKWGLALRPTDPTAPLDYSVKAETLWLLENDTVIEEYIETVLEHDAPFQYASALRLVDYAMNASAPDDRLRPTAGTLARARKAISEDRAFHVIFALNVAHTGENRCTATLTYASPGQTKPSILGGLFARITPKPARNLLQACADMLDAPKRGSD